jgi:hypothetical protein
VTELIRADGVNGPSARLGPQGNLRAADWLYRSRAASLLWLAARLWLGYGWLNAGYQKLWGSEKAVFCGRASSVTVSVLSGTCSPARPAVPRSGWPGHGISSPVSE